jgi:hypothetical protein
VENPNTGKCQAGLAIAALAITTITNLGIVITTTSRYSEVTRFADIIGKLGSYRLSRASISLKSFYHGIWNTI